MAGPGREKEPLVDKKAIKKGVRHEIVVSGDHEQIPGAEEGVVMERTRSRWHFLPSWRVIEPIGVVIAVILIVVLLIIWAYFAVLRKS
jgi:anti-sigma-K factor RskA